MTRKSLGTADLVKNMFPFYDMTNTQFFNFIWSNTLANAHDNSNPMPLKSCCSIFHKINSKNVVSNALSGVL